MYIISVEKISKFKVIVYLGTLVRLIRTSRGIWFHGDTV